MRRIHGLALATLLAALAALALAPAAMARDYEVKVTNLTAGQPLTPPVVATHKHRRALFAVGAPASVGVREIAENGNSAPLLAFLDADPLDMFSGFAESTTGPLVPPGTPGDGMFDQSATVAVSGSTQAKRLSFVSMLVCTNDGFTGADGLRLPRKVGRSVVAHTGSYDAFTELNSEDFAHIVPPCQALIGSGSGEPGSGVSDPALAEGGVIAHHAGIAGGSDLDPALHGWTDPVARVKVTRTG